MAQQVTVVNRTKNDLHGMWDGKHVTLPPGESTHPIRAAIAFKNQNPIMGTEDPYTSACEYKVGIKDHGDDISPWEPDGAEPLERLNRELVLGEGQGFVVQQRPVFSSGPGLTELPERFADPNLAVMQ